MLLPVVGVPAPEAPVSIVPPVVGVNPPVIALRRRFGSIDKGAFAAWGGGGGGGGAGILGAEHMALTGG